MRNPLPPQPAREPGLGQGLRHPELETRLDPARFVRVHRSFIINLAALQALERTDSDAYAARMKNGKRIPISRSGYDGLRAAL